MPIALITGGASALAEGAARSLIEDGWKVVLSDINANGAAQVAKELGGSKVATSAHLDVTRPDDIKALVESVVAENGSLDGLVNAAGGFRGMGIPWKIFVETTPDEWDRLLNANLNGVLNMCYAVLPQMTTQKKGVIVSIAAGRGIRGGRKATIYSAAKAAIIAFSQALAQEVGPQGVRVNTIAPGSAEARWKTGNDESQGNQPPLGRKTSARDVGDAIAFLMSDRASHITGSCLDVSGGVTLH